MLWTRILSFSAFAVVGTAAAQQPGNERAHPGHSNWAACCGYDYNYAEVCPFSEMVAGYSLPSLNASFFRGNKRLTKLVKPRPPDESNPVWEEFEFRGDGLTGTVLRRANVAFFETFQVDAARIPANLRLKSDLLILLGRDTRSDEVEVACEKWSVHLHFAGDKLSWVRLRDSRRAYD